MSNLAILVASTTYSNLNRLDCCHDDLVAMKELLEATENYEQIEVIENASADELKDKIRAPIEKKQSLSGIFSISLGMGFNMKRNSFFVQVISMLSAQTKPGCRPQSFTRC